jgi:VanZ family protein
MQTDNDIVRYHLPPVLWMILIFVSSSLPETVFPEVKWWGWAKIVHVIFYAVLCFLTWRSVHHQDKFPWLANHSAFVGFLAAFAYGSLDEIHQIFTRGRHPMVSDVLIDCLGACLFLAGLELYRIVKGLDETAY